MVSNPHIIVVPCPAQGHVMPLMELSCCLVDQGFKVTFVNTEFIHARLMGALQDKGNEMGQLHMVSIPDGLPPEDDRKDSCTLYDAIHRVMPGELERLITKINESNAGEKITCAIADESMGWALEVAGKMGIRRAAFWPAAAGLKALMLHVPKLIEAGTIDDKGTPKKNETVWLSPSMPGMNTSHFTWQCIKNSRARQTIFQVMVKNNRISEAADWLICNSFYELDPSAFSLVPKFMPIGPLLTGNPIGHFWQEDSTCLAWLDQQPTKSVIYVAFGSITMFSQSQFEELAFGLELLGRPFLWVIRSDGGVRKPDGFHARVAGHGKMVGWAPQQKVLAHPSVACFLSHCGWNSTIEGASKGVPFICWPYAVDQFLNRSYITDVWKVGLGLNPDENGIISREEIKNKVNEVVGDKEMKARALKLKEMAMKNVSKGGYSSKNFEDFVEGMKCQHFTS